MMRQILWQRWVNPFEPLTEEPQPLKDILSNEFDDMSWNSYIDNKEYEEENNEINYQKVNSKAILTPMGVIPLNENMACTKVFKFWIGHTNFDLSAQIKEIIENTEGVEALDIFTRYRFRIAIGRAFRDRDVMQSIQKKLYEK